MKNKEKSVSLSQKVKEKIIEYIKERNLQPDSLLPSEVQLMEMLGVSRYTVREALALLEQDKILYKIQGKGTFINKVPTHIESGLEKLESITEIIESFGYEPGTIWIDIKEELPTKDMMDKMGLKEGEKVITFTRVRTANQKVAVYCVDTIKKMADMEEVPKRIEDESMFDYFKKKYGIEPEYAIADIIPTLPTAEMIKHMKIKKNQLFLLLHQIHYDKEGNPQIYSMDYFNTDVFKFKVNRLR
ncbi:putative HTH-type transcriptional regulator ymfC [Proteiniborus sp. DW1]|uniref:GntR family transcriptional regulator n=1 Tax=Proteiniborus sp. DW1 TaxID=1889883 RepID=UPI00092E1374|nr:GntR family transcriptional regulator [Proteiniborus sp. DW1]SCG83934.1 putative HTH-type transcriptional regulator ymfC [Proteiniborus sp. DW1]